MMFFVFLSEMQTRRNQNLSGVGIHQLLLEGGGSTNMSSKVSLSQQMKRQNNKREASAASPDSAALPEKPQKRERRRVQIERQLTEPAMVQYNPPNQEDTRLENERKTLIEQQQFLIDKFQYLLEAATQRSEAAAREQQRIETATQRSEAPAKEQHIETATQRSEVPAKEQQRIEAATQPDTNEIFLVLDTESFKIPTELSSHTLVPLQIAWAIYEWNKESLVQISRTVAYVSEVMCTSNFRDEIRSISERCFLRHEAKIKESKYPMMSATDIFKCLKNDIDKYGVNTIAAYNISWDFEAIGNLLRIFYPDGGVDILFAFDARCDNPFNRMRLSYVDLMHEVIKKFGERLARSGIADGTVHRSTNGKVMLRKNERFSKTIYSAEYTLYNLFGIVQKHLAEEDVDHESRLLEVILQEFGADDLEYNILYPQHSSYEQMSRIATKILIEDIETEEEECEAAEVLTGFLRMDTPYPTVPVKQDVKQDSCLFDEHLDKY